MNPKIPIGFCQCGCGQPTQRANKTSKRDGTIKGIPVQFIRGHKIKSKHTIEERFWSKVHKLDGPNACWTWTAGHGKHGYGMFNITKREPISAHRMAWKLTYGDIPKGLCVCHHCDNKPCCRPDHLFLGTIADNNKDMVKKGRCKSRGLPGRKINTINLPRGEKHHNSKLTNNQIKQIRQKYADSKIHKGNLAKQYGITYSTLWRICTKKPSRTWKHIY